MDTTSPPAPSQTKSPHPQQAFIDGLRHLADWIEQRPALPKFNDHLYINVFTYTKEDFAAAARVAGKTKKVFMGSFAICRVEFGPVRFDINAPRDQVCRRVLVGEKTIPSQPAQPERVEPVYEWECEPILAARSAGGVD